MAVVNELAKNDNERNRARLHDLVLWRHSLSGGRLPLKEMLDTVKVAADEQGEMCYSLAIRQGRQDRRQPGIQRRRHSGRAQQARARRRTKSAIPTRTRCTRTGRHSSQGGCLRPRKLRGPPALADPGHVALSPERTVTAATTHHHHDDLHLTLGSCMRLLRAPSDGYYDEYPGYPGPQAPVGMRFAPDPTPAPLSPGHAPPAGGPYGSPYAARPGPGYDYGPWRR